MWQPITREDFVRLLDEQRQRLDDDERRALSRFEVPLSTATLRRTEEAGDETVFVIARTPDGILYFDDVEYGFEFSPVDASGRIREPTANQLDLPQAVSKWLVPSVGQAGPPSGGVDHNDGHGWDQFPVVRSGTWWYGGTEPARIRIVRSPKLYGSGDPEDPPEWREDRAVESFYVRYSPPVGPFGDTVFGPYLALEAAVQDVERTIRGPVEWDPEAGKT